MKTLLCNCVVATINASGRRDIPGAVRVSTSRAAMVDGNGSLRIRRALVTSAEAAAATGGNRATSNLVVGAYRGVTGEPQCAAFPGGIEPVVVR